MKAYADFLIKQHLSVEYIEATKALSDITKLVAHLQRQKVVTIHIAETVDNWLQKKLEQSCAIKNIEIVKYTTPNFLNTMGGVETYFDKKKTYFQTGFYTDQRKQRNILLDAGGQPEGGQWTFDADNREKFPKTAQAPKIIFSSRKEYMLRLALLGQTWFANYFKEERKNIQLENAETVYESMQLLAKSISKSLQDRFILHLTFIIESYI